MKNEAGSYWVQLVLYLGMLSTAGGKERSVSEDIICRGHNLDKLATSRTVRVHKLKIKSRRSCALLEALPPFAATTANNI